MIIEDDKIIDSKINMIIYQIGSILHNVFKYKTYCEWLIYVQMVNKGRNKIEIKVILFPVQ